MNRDRRKVLAIKLDAGNDTNGNPRRVFVIIDRKSGNMIDAIDEGYGGRQSLLDVYPNAIEGPTYVTTPRQYHSTIRWARNERALAKGIM
jgi:hypothetical protein